MSGEEISLEGLTDPACTRVEGIPNSEALIRFVDAMLDTNQEDLNVAREILINELGAEAMVDAAAVASHFQRMDRIADATGIPLESEWPNEDDDSKVYEVTKEINEQLGLNDFQSAANTPKSS